MPISFQLRIAAQFIVILGLVGFYAEDAMAQTAPQLRLAALGSPETPAEPALAPSQEPSRHVIAGSLLQTRSPNYFDGYLDRHEATCFISNAKYLSDGNSPAPSNLTISSPIDLGLAQSVSLWTQIWPASKSRNAVGAAGYGRLDFLSNFIAAYQSLRKLLDVRAPSLVKKYAALTSTAIVGVASTYNPYRDRPDSNAKQTASGELYNPAAWTAAIPLDMREQFRGVRYGKNYQPAYALVESGKRSAIVRINDVGRLRPGRVIDLNERSMRYFDPTLQRGLINDVKVTLLSGESWMPGPIDREQLLNVASAQ